MRIIRRHALRPMAFFFLIEIVFNLFLPTVSWALTAGPTAPEASSFEPVDTSDMVDLKTGDFNYNLPILEIPGPAGGYPLSLSNHSNIQPNQDASWVGLGWSLSPGAINRFVSGYPDDHELVKNVNRDFWEGGETTTYNVGLSVGFAGGASAGVQLSFANDTYRGRGVGFGVNAGVGPISVSGGQTAYGQTYSSVSLSYGIGQRVGKSSVGVGFSVGVSLSSGGDVSTGWGVGLTGVREVDTGQTDPSTGAKISTTESTVGLGTGGGIGGVFNGKVGNVSTINKHFNIDIPIYCFTLRLGRDYQRYWIDETAEAETYGSLYLNSSSNDFNKAFDTFDLLDTDINLGEFDNVEQTLGGSFPDVDSYVVTGQGIGGSMEPKIYQRNLYRQDKKIDDDVITKGYPLGTQLQAKPADFRFNGDFSNRYEYSPGNLNVNGSTLSFEFGGSPSTGPSGSDGLFNNRLAGSQHVKSFKNSEIISGTAKSNGFINTVVAGVPRLSDSQTGGDSQIGGFSITNPSGVTYHYALPAYSAQEVFRSQNTAKQQETGGLYYNMLTKPEKYAYTWFLTSVTGPDYVDRNNNGLADHGDWGYWVDFQYSRWLKDYKWRNPGEGFNMDIDNFDVFSAGEKEIYYLDRVITQSHVAVFEKSIRNDGRETSDKMNGGFDSKLYYDPECPTTCEPVFQPRPLQKLDMIKLYRYEDFQANNLTATIKSIKLNYDYSLAPGTSNSFQEPNFNVKLGKLTLTSVVFQGKGGVQILPPVKFEYKNMPYNKDKYDCWGYYKNDYQSSKNKNFDRRTTPASAVDVDAWGLRKVISSLGSAMEIEYESDRYIQPALYRMNLLTVRSVETNATNHSITIKFFDPPSGLSNFSDVINTSKLDFLFRTTMFARENCACGNQVNTVNSAMGNYYAVKSATLQASDVLSFLADGIEVRNDALFDFLTTIPANTNYTDSPCVNLAGGEVLPMIKFQVPIFVSGNLFYNSNTESYGGGTRVKQITLEQMNGQTIREFEYANGTTSYEPIGFGRVNFDFANWPASPWDAEQKRIQKARIDYKTVAYPNLSKLLSVSRVIPGPGVLYQNVNVKVRNVDRAGRVFDMPTYTAYEFEVFKEGMTGFDPGNSVNKTRTSGLYGGVMFNQINTKKVVLKDYTARIGNLNRISLIASDGTLLQQTQFHFLHETTDGTFDQNRSNFESDLATQFNNQGVVEQTFSRAHIVKYKEGSSIPYPTNPAVTKFGSDEWQLLGVVSKREMFPNVPTGRTVINYKTGIKEDVKNIEFDFFSGEVTRSMSSDGYGNKFLTATTPAFRLVSYAEMGIGANGGKNMLSQVAVSSVFHLDADGVKDGLVGASIQTWSDQIPAVPAGENAGIQQPHIWRKHANFSFVGTPNVSLTTEFYPLGDYNAKLFSAWNRGDNVPTGWQKNVETTLYDVYSLEIEAMDLNGKFAATKLSMDQSRVMASASMSNYFEMAYSGAEENLLSGNQISAGVYYGGSGIVSTAHTGSKAVQANVNQQAFKYSFKPQAKTYHVSVWSSKPSAKIGYKVGSGAAAFANVKQIGQSGSWYLLEADMNVTGSWNSMDVWCEPASESTVFDDFRFHPKDASMLSYVYSPLGDLINILDDNNLYTQYQYDAMGKVTGMYRETFKPVYGQQGKVQVMQTDYNYGANNPYVVSLTASKTGPSGALAPLGNVSVVQGRDIEFSIQETCGTQRLKDVFIDNAKMNFNQGAVVLFDGSKVDVTTSAVRFSNIQSSHTIQVNFTVPPLGMVQCHKEPGAGGISCFDGTWEYGYYNACGAITDLQFASSLSEIPADLRSLANSCPNVPCGDQQ